MPTPTKKGGNGVYFVSQPGHSIATGGRVNLADDIVGPEMPPPESAPKGNANSFGQNTAALESTWPIKLVTLRPQAAESTQRMSELAQ
mmetsp:Transcript_38349/g.81852  ORF Transcript_38349/g.81852 Transcript_38349/m.81852 type:complete len:88 (-) Transcript_38349:61-324(-)